MIINYLWRFQAQCIRRGSKILQRNISKETASSQPQWEWTGMRVSLEANIDNQEPSSMQMHPHPNKGCLLKKFRKPFRNLERKTVRQSRALWLLARLRKSWFSSPVPSPPKAEWASAVLTKVRLWIHISLLSSIFHQCQECGLAFYKMTDISIAKMELRQNVQRKQYMKTEMKQNPSFVLWQPCASDSWCVNMGAHFSPFRSQAVF